MSFKIWTRMLQMTNVFPFCMGPAMSPLWIGQKSNADTQEVVAANLRPSTLLEDSQDELDKLLEASPEPLPDVQAVR